MKHLQNSMVRATALLAMLLTIGASLQSADFKVGTYSVTAGDSKFSIKYEDNGKVTVSRNGEVAVEGVYKVTGDTIEVTDEKGPMACGGDSKTGKYKWKLEGKKLTFTKIEDGCDGRAGALTAQAWVQE
ncbi:MAG TPA: hypothetical protein VFD58_29340 [Blastocatellia bacterium]|nr:hypothetical protein [Blastocatellia bacterium]